MAQGGKIKKGFFFYFGLFVLLLVAAFLVCLVIMMFNPGKSVIWMQYFTSNTHFLIEKTTGEDSHAIDWGEVREIYITTDYANVVVENNSDPARQGNGVYILNKAKGFAVSKNAVPFSYTVTQTGTRVEIDVTCPKGFLYFSKNVEIAVHKSQRVAGAKLRDDLKVNIVTTDGDVDIGGPSTKAAVDAKLAQLSVKCTGKGDVQFSQNFDPSLLTKLEVTTAAGSIRGNKIFSSNSTNVQGLQTNCDVNLKTYAGDIVFDNLLANGKAISLSNQKGNIKIGNLSAENLKFEDCTQGNYVLDSVSANVDFTYSEDSIATPNFIFGDVAGDFTFSAIGANAKPSIDIKSVSGKLQVSTNGSLRVQKASGSVDVHSDGSLAADVTVAENNTNLIALNLEAGSATLRFAKNIPSSVNITTNSANVNLFVTQYANFSATMHKNTQTQPAPALDHSSDVTVNVGSLQNRWEDDTLVVGGPQGSVAGNMTIKTNAHVYLNLM